MGVAEHTRGSQVAVGAAVGAGVRTRLPLLLQLLLLMEVQPPSLRDTGLQGAPMPRPVQSSLLGEQGVPSWPLSSVSSICCAAR